jgi:hypothetical protein
MADEPIAATALAFLGKTVLLDNILGSSNRKTLYTSRFEEARRALCASSFAVVISEACFSDNHSWKDLLQGIRILVNPPPLIVVDRLRTSGFGRKC